MVQQLRKSITALALFLIAGGVHGQPAQPPLTLKQDAPERVAESEAETAL